MKYAISPDNLNFEAVKEIYYYNARLFLSKKSVELIQRCRDYLDLKLENHTAQL